MREYISTKVVELQEAEDKIFEAELGAEDLQDEWQQLQDVIQKSIVKKAEQEGIERQLFYDFAEFDLSE